MSRKGSNSHTKHVLRIESELFTICPSHIQSETRFVISSSALFFWYFFRFSKTIFQKIDLVVNRFKKFLCVCARVQTGKATVQFTTKSCKITQIQTSFYKIEKNIRKIAPTSWLRSWFHFSCAMCRSFTILIQSSKRVLYGNLSDFWT